MTEKPGKPGEKPVPSCAGAKPMLAEAGPGPGPLFSELVDRSVDELKPADFYAGRFVYA